MTNNEKALQMHKEWNGKLETTAKAHVNSREDLAIAYTPGVAEPCKVIAKDPEAAYTYTMKANTVAVVSDGSAVLGLGNIGALAAMPVMEGKCALFKAFAGIDAVPICINSKDLPGYAGYRGNHSLCCQYCTCFWWYQSGGHLRTTLL